jgi:hypothetical protein
MGLAPVTRGTRSRCTVVSSAFGAGPPLLVAFASAATHAAFCIVCLADRRLGPAGQWMIDYLSNPSSR